MCGTSWNSYTPYRVCLTRSTINKVMLKKHWSSLHCIQRFQLTDVKYTYFEKRHIIPSTSEDPYSSILERKCKFSILEVSELLRSVWHKHLGWEKSYIFWIFRTTDGKTKTQINYIFFKDDKIWKYVSDKYDSRQTALPKSTRAILRLPFCKCTFECFYCFHFLYLTEEQIKNFGSHRQVHFTCRRNLTEAHRILKHDAHCNLVCFLC